MLRWLAVFFLIFSFHLPDTLHAAPKRKTHKVTKKRYTPPKRINKSGSKRVTKKAPVSKRLKRSAKRAIKQHVPAPKKKVHPAHLIVLDPGHGGFDLGASSHNCSEKYLCLSTGFLVKKHLNALGYRVVMTRTRDVFLSLGQRTQLANKVRGKLFVSLHYNAAKTSDAHGIEVFFYNGNNRFRAQQSKKLAVNVLSHMRASTNAVSRGVKKGNFHVIRETTMPAILVEGGFITNAPERLKLVDVKYRDKIAKSIADGIHKYFTA